MENQISTESWDGLIYDPFLKAEDVPEETSEFVVMEVKINSVDQEKRPKTSLTLMRGEEKFRFDLNIGNTRYVREEAKIPNPSALKGKILLIKKELTVNPRTGKQVDGLRICGVRDA